MRTAFISAMTLHCLSTAALAAEPRLEKDIPYLGPDRTEKMDAYLPTDNFERPTPAILLIHGGGWSKGSKSDARERNIGETLSSHGYAVFSIDYKLNKGRTAWPQNLYDCKSGLRFIRSEAARFGVDPRRIAVMGGSAGGHLSMLVGVTGRQEEMNCHGLYLDQSNEVSCILTFYGDYDIRGRKYSPVGGKTPEETAANEAAASPITYLDEKTPPFFITHGTDDRVVSVERSRQLARHLEKLGVAYEHIEIEGAPHTYHLQPKEMDLRPATLAFLEKHLGKPVAK